MLRGDVQKAKESFQIAMKEDSTNREAIMLLAKIMLRLGDYYGAFGVYDDYLKDAGG